MQSASLLPAKHIVAGDRTEEWHSSSVGICGYLSEIVELH